MRAKIIGLRNIRSGPGWADNWPALLFTNFMIGRSFFLILKCGCLARSVVLRQRGCRLQVPTGARQVMKWVKRTRWELCELGYVWPI